jgi:chemotaxis family two-component system response regulator PixG
MSQEWQQAGLGSFKPSLAPLLKPEAASKLSSVLTKYLDGKYTLWDIGIGLKRNVAEITQYLLPLVAKGVIQLKEIPDLAAPKLKVAQKTTAIDTPSQASTESSKKLIACIDDSPVVAHNLKKILNPAGYEILTIDEPMHGFSKLIDYKPGLIFLDLNMPNADGYSVCQFLRNTHVFEKTPIIILTAQDTLIDRTRAKIVGATDFIGKPADPQKVLEMVKKHLN